VIVRDKEKEMKHAKIVAILALFFLFASQANGAILKEGDKFLPFSLVSSHDDIYTVTLEEGKLTVKIEPMAGGEEKIFHPDSVLLDFWATWCVPCRKAMPHMQKLHEKYKPDATQPSGGLILLGISIDTKGNRVVKPFFNKLDYTYPMLADPTEGAEDVIRTAKDMKSQYKVQAIPVVYLIDSTGIIQHAHTGFKEKDIEDIENAINTINALPGEKSR
jgi:thiol-disulfide isomerase/thioredoxin